MPQIYLCLIFSYCAAAGVFILSWRLIGLREIYLLVVCGGLTAFALFGLQMPWTIFDAAINQAVFLMAFLLLLALLHEVAVTSPAVADCGQFRLGSLQGGGILQSLGI